MTHYRLVTPDETVEFEDGVKAVMAYVNAVCVRKVPATLMETFEDTPITLPPHVLGVYDGWAPTATHSIRVRLGEPQPAFPRERGDAEPPIRDSDRWVAAVMYAKGWIDAIGPLGEFASADPVKFADSATAQNAALSVAEAWKQWAQGQRDMMRHRDQPPAGGQPNISYLPGGEHDPNLGPQI